jgi:hypothetical protein
MKAKKFQRKLSISKETIANLTNAEMQVQHGGATETCGLCTNRTCWTDCKFTRCLEC